MQEEPNTKEQLELELHRLRDRILELEQEKEAIRRAGLALTEEASRDGIVVLDEDGKVFEANPAFAEMLGCSEEEVRRLHVWDWDAQLTRWELEEALRTVNDSGGRYITRHMRRDGSVYWVEVTANATTREGRKLIRCVCRDLSDRLKVEEALRENNENFRKLALEASFEPIVFHCDGIIVDANETFASMFGHLRDELIGKAIVSLVKVESHSVAQMHWHSELEKTYEAEAVRRDGTVFPVEVHSKIIPYLGKIMRVASVRDITGRKRSEEALRAAHRQLTDIIEFLPDATLVVDIEGRVVAWNRAMELMTGIAKEEILLKGDYAYAVPFYGEPRPMLIDLVLDPRTDHHQNYESIRWNQKTLYAEVPADRLRGGYEIYLLGAASPLCDGDGKLIGAIESIRDVTKLKEMASALQQRERTLENKKLELEETNTALKVLLRNRENDRQEMEENIVANIKEMILPCLEKLKTGRLDENQRTCLDILESHLNAILSPFLKNLSARLAHLTPMEIQVASLVKEGKTSKEIAQLLGVAGKTVSGHRYNLRIKLGLKNKKTNLRSHLLTLG